MKLYVLPNQEITESVEVYLSTWRSFYDQIDVIFKPFNLQICCANYQNKDIYMANPAVIDSLHKAEDHAFKLPLTIAYYVVGLYNECLSHKEIKLDTEILSRLATHYIVQWENEK